MLGWIKSWLQGAASNTPSNQSSGWRNYVSDKFRNVLWTWSYAPAEERPIIVNLTPVCPVCGSSARAYQDDDSLVLFCSLCDNILDSTVATEAGYREVIRQMIDEVIRNCHGG